MTDGCTDPDCGRWLHIVMPPTGINVLLMSRVAVSMPEGTMWTEDPDNPAVQPGHINLHVPHDADLSMARDDDDE